MIGAAAGERDTTAVHMPGGSGGAWLIRESSGAFRVHRPTGLWTPAVHALLRHLALRGLDGVPRVHGIDDSGREVLDYLPGTSPDPDTAEVSDDALAAAAAWLRGFHEAVRDFGREPLEWRQGVQRPGPGEIICHNDPGLTNWVMRDGEFAGVIDWDRAGPGLPIDDLAFMCWSAIPLMRPIPAEAAARRLILVAEAYGDVAPIELLDALGRRLGLIEERWAAGLAREDPGTVALRDTGVMARHRDRVLGFSKREGGIREALGAAGSEPPAGTDLPAGSGRVNGERRRDDRTPRSTR